MLGHIQMPLRQAEARRRRPAPIQPPEDVQRLVQKRLHLQPIRPLRLRLLERLLQNFRQPAIHIPRMPSSRTGIDRIAPFPVQPPSDGAV